MTSIDPRRQLLLELFQAGLRRVDGRLCTAQALRAAAGSQISRTWTAAIGKAACAMALGAQDALGASQERLLLITKDGHVAVEARSLPGAEILESAHPIPDARSIAAGERLLRWMQELPEDAEPLFLISGGASSLVEALVAGVSLEDLKRLNDAGIASGVGIAELNANRARVSRIKAGRLTAQLGGRRARALFISDVPGDDPAVIGSGLLGPAAEGIDNVERTVIASIDDAVAAVSAAAQARGYSVRSDAERFEGDARRLGVRFSIWRSRRGASLPVAMICSCSPPVPMGRTARRSMPVRSWMGKPARALRSPSLTSRPVLILPTRVVRSLRRATSFTQVPLAQMSGIS